MVVLVDVLDVDLAVEVADLVVDVQGVVHLHVL